jgi:hypothetical protein
MTVQQRCEGIFNPLADILQKARGRRAIHNAVVKRQT